jgi:hypothetical protein
MLVAAPHPTGSVPQIRPPDPSRPHAKPVIQQVQPISLAAAPVRHFPKAYVAVGSLALGVVIGVALWVARKPRAADPPKTGSEIAQPRPDDWTVEVEAEGADEAEITSNLQLRAMRAAIGQIESELPGTIRAQAVQPLQRSVLTLDGRPESRIEIQQRAIDWKRAPKLQARARYAMSGAVRSRLRNYFSETKTVSGLVVINAPPSRPPGVLVLTAPPTSNAVPGDRVVAIAGHTISDLADVQESAGQVEILGEILIEHNERRALAAVKER